MANPPVLWGGNNSSIGLQNRFLMANGVSLDSNGVKNYITYCNFANLQTTGWSLGTTGTLTNGIPTGTPTFGSGASGNLSLSVTTTGTLQGLGSLLLTSSAATTAGNMLATQAYTIESADQAKVLTASFVYSVPTNPANGNFSGTSSNSFGIACYDVTNSSWLPVVGNFSMTQNSGAGNAVVTMQTNATTASVRFVIYNANASAGAIALEFDRFFLGPQVSQIGPVMTDWQAYTPTFTGLGTPTNVLCYWRRVGDSVAISGSLTSGTATAVAITATLPSGAVADSSKISSSAYTIVGTWANGTASQAYQSAIIEGGQSAIALGYANSSGTVPYTAGGNSSTQYTFQAVIPIAGWSSNVQMSNDTDTRVVAAQVGLTTSQAVGSGAVVKFDTVTSDTHAAYSTSTGLYTAPVTGYYSVSTGIVGSAGGTSYVKVAGVSKGYFASLTASTVVAGTKTVFAKAGDTIGCYLDTANTLSSIAAEGFVNYMIIQRLSGPAVIAANESINARYGGTVSSISGTTSAVTFNTKSFDSHNAYSGSTYTIPVSGVYNILGSLNISWTGATGGSSAVSIYIYKNGAPDTLNFQYIPLSAAGQNVITVSNNIKCLAGDTIQIFADSNATSPALANDASRTFFSIARIGR